MGRAKLSTQGTGLKPHLPGFFWAVENPDDDVSRVGEMERGSSPQDGPSYRSKNGPTGRSYYKTAYWCSETRIPTGR